MSLIKMRVTPLNTTLLENLHEASLKLSIYLNEKVATLSALAVVLGFLRSLRDFGAWCQNRAVRESEPELHYFQVIYKLTAFQASDINADFGP